MRKRSAQTKLLSLNVAIFYFRQLIDSTMNRIFCLCLTFLAVLVFAVLVLVNMQCRFTMRSCDILLLLNHAILPIANSLQCHLMQILIYDYHFMHTLNDIFFLVNRQRTEPVYQINAFDHVHSYRKKKNLNYIY